MIDLPLAMLSGTATPSSEGGLGAEQGDSFREVLTDLLGDVGHEVVEMVEALEALTERSVEDQAYLTTVGWPLPQLLALANVTADAELVELADDAIVDELPEFPGEPGARVDGEQAVESGEESDPPDLAPAAVTSAAANLAGSEAETEDEPAPGQVRRSSGSPMGRAERSDSRPTTDSSATAGQVTSTDESAQDDPDALSTPVRRRPVATAAAGQGRERPAPMNLHGSRPEVARVPTDAPVSEAADITASTSTTSASRPVGVDRSPGLTLALQRVLEAVERLELLPPPRALTVDLGEHRLRVAMEDGQVRLSLLDGDRASGDEFLRRAREELAQQGFDLGADDEGPEYEAHDDAPAGDPSRPPAHAPRPVATGLRL